MSLRKLIYSLKSLQKIVKNYQNFAQQRTSIFGFMISFSVFYFSSSPRQLLDAIVTNYLGTNEESLLIETLQQILLCSG